MIGGGNDHNTRRWPDVCMRLLEDTILEFLEALQSVSSLDQLVALSQWYLSALISAFKSRQRSRLLARYRPFEWPTKSVFRRLCGTHIDQPRSTCLMLCLSCIHRKVPQLGGCLGLQAWEIHAILCGLPPWFHEATTESAPQLRRLRPQNEQRPKPLRWYHSFLCFFDGNQAVRWLLCGPRASRQPHCLRRCFPCRSREPMDWNPKPWTGFYAVDAPKIRLLRTDWSRCFERRP